MEDLAGDPPQPPPPETSNDEVVKVAPHETIPEGLFSKREQNIEGPMRDLFSGDDGDNDGDFETDSSESSSIRHGIETYLLCA
ncbi:unnamed protein product [Trichobilharzia regenti]|nr:unnamed protein product [Trichobilharzia regenti]